MALDGTKRAVQKLLAKPKKERAEAELWAMLKQKQELGLIARRPYEWQWILNMAFIFGKQYTIVDAHTSRLLEISKDPQEIRSVDNQIITRWRRQVTDFVKGNPEIAAVPASEMEDDRVAAKLATKVAKAFWFNRRMRMKLRETGLWLYSTGNCFLGDWWNPRLDPVGFDPESGEFKYAGDADVVVWSPFNVLGPTGQFGIAHPDALPWLMFQRVQPLDYYGNEYGSKGKGVSEESDQGLNVLSAVTNVLNRSSAEKVPSAMELHLKIKPCREYPKGLSLIAANSVVLHKEDYPYDSYHLEHLKDIEIPGVFWGKATTEDAIPLQRDWNRDTSSISNFNVWMGKGKWKTPRGSHMSVRPDDTHGQIIEFDPVLGHEPSQVDVKGLPTTYDQNLVRIKMSIQDLYSQHEVSRGTNKSDIRSGEMVSLLLEQDALGGHLPRATFEESLEALLTRVIKRIAKGYTAERLRVYGNSEDELEILSFKGSDLGNNTTIKVFAQSSVPETRFAREMRIERRFQQGFYGDPRDPKVRRHVAKMLEDAVVDNIFADTYLDEKLAHWENQNFAKGTIVVPNLYDNHAIHLECHSRYLKQISFQEKKQKDKRLILVEANLGKHMQMHQNFLDEQMRAQVMMMQKQGGGNGGK